MQEEEEEEEGGVVRLKALVRMTISVSCDCLKLVTTLPSHSVAPISSLSRMFNAFQHNTLLVLNRTNVLMVGDGINLQKGKIGQIII